MGKQNNSINGIRIPAFLQTDKIRQSKLSGPEIKQSYSFLVQIYGEVCSICGNPPESNTRLDIEHIDENPLHHYWKNLQLAHHNCNCKKRSKDKNKRRGRIKIPVFEDLSFQSGESRLKKVYLTSFLEFVETEFADIEQCNYKTFLTDAAAVCGFASEETIKRYLRLLCSSKINILEKFTDNRTGIDYLRKKKDFMDLRKIFRLQSL